MSDIVWKTPKRPLDEIIQDTDDYVVHGRGFLIENELWFDELASRGGHLRWWYGHLQHVYGTDDWNDQDVFDTVNIYFSITGASEFLLQHPEPEDFERETWKRLKWLIVDEFGFHVDQSFTWDMQDGPEEYFISDVMSAAQLQ